MLWGSLLRGVFYEVGFERLRLDMVLRRRLPCCTGLPPTLWGAAVPNNYGKNLRQLVEEMYGDFDHMVRYCCCTHAQEGAYPSAQQRCSTRPSPAANTLSVICDVANHFRHAESEV